MTYRLPRNIFDMLLEALGDKQKTEVFARAIESSIQAIDDKAVESITEKKHQLKAELYNDLRSELATKEFVRAEIGEVRAEIGEVRAEMRNMQTLMKVLIGLMVFGLTFANPAFIELIKSVK
ncbi:MAG: hypothetical protein IE928_01725 [Gammaproteobacteria bacterium]|nr:hypothetical protein [Gammaproteobacteria bacterium]